LLDRFLHQLVDVLLGGGHCSTSLLSVRSNVAGNLIRCRSVVTASCAAPWLLRRSRRFAPPDAERSDVVAQVHEQAAHHHRQPDDLERLLDADRGEVGAVVRIERVPQLPAHELHADRARDEHRAGDEEVVPRRARQRQHEPAEHHQDEQAERGVGDRPRPELPARRLEVERAGERPRQLLVDERALVDRQEHEDPREQQPVASPPLRRPLPAAGRDARARHPADGEQGDRPARREVRLAVHVQQARQRRARREGLDARPAQDEQREGVAGDEHGEHHPHHDDRSPRVQYEVCAPVVLHRTMMCRMRTAFEDLPTRARPGVRQAGPAPRRRGAIVAVLSVLAFALSLLVQFHVVPLHSDDRDEGVYIFQAEMLREGMLTLPEDEYGEFFRPWLSGSAEGRIFTEYQVGFPLFLAAADLLLGSMRLGLALVAALTVPAAYGFTRNLLGDRRVAPWGAGLVARPPMSVPQSRRLVSYSLTVPLPLAASWALLAAANRASVRLALAGGVLTGAALLVRPMDVVLWMVPVVVL